jgi:predicted acylesterase/phospholipase RssA
MNKPTAIILAGGIAKSAFEVGVLKVITQNPDLNIKSIIGASSGALNCCALAAGLITNNTQLAINDLIDVWTNKAGWNNVIKLNFRSILDMKGLSNSNKLHKLIKTSVENIISTGIGMNPIELRFAITQLSGKTAFVDGKPNTTFESNITFNNQDFLDISKRELIYTAACASSAFPFLFAPVYVPEYGWCIDGGMTNNVAIKTALQEQDIERIIIISPFPFISASHDNYEGLNLTSRIGDIIINERLYRDLVEAEKVNGIVKKLETLRTKKEISNEQYEKIEAILHNKKHIEIVQIRPSHKLEGNSFSGLFNKHLRMKYIGAGMEAAKKIKL